MQIIFIFLFLENNTSQMEKISVRLRRNKVVLLECLDFEGAN